MSGFTDEIRLFLDDSFQNGLVSDPTDSPYDPDTAERSSSEHSPSELETTVPYQTTPTATKPKRRLEDKEEEEEQKGGEARRLKPSSFEYGSNAVIIGELHRVQILITKEMQKDISFDDLTKLETIHSNIADLFSSKRREILQRLEMEYKVKEDELKKLRELIENQKSKAKILPSVFKFN